MGRMVFFLTFFLKQLCPKLRDPCLKCMFGIGGMEIKGVKNYRKSVLYCYLWPSFSFQGKQN